MTIVNTTDLNFAQAKSPIHHLFVNLCIIPILLIIFVTSDMLNFNIFYSFLKRNMVKYKYAIS